MSSDLGRHEPPPAAVAAAMMERDRASQRLGMQVGEAGDGWAEVTMVVRDDMVNGHDLCHGGLIFMLADTAFATACNSGNEVTVAAGASVEFLEPARPGDALVATARRVVERGRSGVYDVDVRTEAGTLIATFRGRSRRIGGTIIPDSTAVGPGEG